MKKDTNRLDGTTNRRPYLDRSPFDVKRERSAYNWGVVAVTMVVCAIVLTTIAMQGCPQ